MGSEMCIRDRDRVVYSRGLPTCRPTQVYLLCMLYDVNSITYIVNRPAQAYMYNCRRTSATALSVANVVSGWSIDECILMQWVSEWSIEMSDSLPNGKQTPSVSP